MASYHDSKQQALRRAQQTGRPFVIYQVRNGQWMYGPLATEPGTGHLRRDARNIEVFYPAAQSSLYY